MQWSRVKSIFIVILLVVDGFLFFNIAGKYLSRYYRQTENAHNIVEILQARGISTGADFSLPEAHALPVLQIDRSRAEEEHFCYGLLGEHAQRSERGGNGTVTYTADRGTMEWRDGGAVSGTFTPEDYVRPEAGEACEKMAQQLLTAAGLSVGSLSYDTDGYTVTVSFPTAGVPVFNRALVLDFSEDAVGLSGMWTFGMPYITKSGNYVTFAAVDALFPLISTTEITQVSGMELGFVLSESGGGRIQMTPGWRIDTNTGSFFVDSLKKSVVAL